MLHIIRGPARAGKSQFLRAKMVEASVEDPSSSFIAIVPEQSTLQMQRSVTAAHPAHVIMNIDIVSFERLAYKVLREVNYPESQLLSDTGRLLLLRNVLEDCADELIVYRNKVRTGGFAAEMKTVITEMRQYDIDDQQLFLMQESARKEGRGLLYSKLQDIRLVYRRYEEALADRYHTQEDLLRAFARAIPDSGLIRGAHIYLDGFTGFTPIQYRVLEALMKYAADVSIALTMPLEPEEFDLSAAEQFQLSSRTLARLRQCAGSVSCETDEQLIPADTPPVKAYVFRAPDPQAEIRYIAGDIRRRIFQDHYRFRDFAIICSDMDAYAQIVREVFREAQITAFIDYKGELGSNAMARMLLAALQVAAERFSYASVFAFLKSGLCDLAADEICQLENYCLEFGIQGFSAWSHDFSANRRAGKARGPQEEAEYFWDLDLINRLREYVVSSLKDVYVRCSGSGKNIRQITEALKDLLHRMQVPEKILNLAETFSESGEEARGKEYEQIPELLNQLLDLMADLMGPKVLTAGEYARILAMAVDEIKVSIIPPSLDAVTVGDLTRTRVGDVKVLYMAGMNDGRMPAPSVQSGLFTRKERDFLKQENFDLAPSVLESLYTQHFYLYLMFSKPSEALYLTYAGMNEKGEEMEPSYILEEAGQILPGLQTETPDTGSMPLWPGSAALSLAEKLRTLAEDPDNADPMHDRELKELLHYFGDKDPDLLGRMIEGALYQSRSLALDEQCALDLYGEVLKGSVSRYETYYQCPFRHFLQYGLDIRERPEYEVRAADVGTIYHDSLEQYARELEQQGLTFRTVTDEQSHEIAKQCALSAAQQMESDVLQSSERLAFLMKRIIRVTEKTTDVLRMQVRDGLYEPEYFEMPFEDEIDSHARFRGRIDRVDIYDAGDILVKVIDYKSGAKKFSVRDIYTGQQLQLAAYLRAAMQEAQRQNPGKRVAAGGVYYYLIQDRFVRSEKDAEEKYRMSGLTNARPEAIHAIDTTLEGKTGSNIAEISFTSSGLSARSKVASDAEFEHLMQFTEQKIRSAGEQIRNGDVAIAPSYESRSRNACIYCDYHDVCKFEDGKRGAEYRRVPENITTEDMERELYGRS